MPKAICRLGLANERPFHGPRICGLTNDLALIASSIASDNSENPEFYGANSR
jgi:hypothetical protein